MSATCRTSASARAVGGEASGAPSGRRSSATRRQRARSALGVEGSTQRRPASATWRVARGGCRNCRPQCSIAAGRAGTLWGAVAD
eukprot:2600811-Pyramimonas_sp.AAC.1